ncbi:hypothetical protein VIM7927_02775 [Vibrio mangrovi]|uniref:Uncharacterized protein n=1 Tax=Vibrio mangrovi TaxID=474394 RepID=A0A1Y6IUX8_9VIBR|nr:hypothetical protein VIM7927_02775 [Vibrio mangrovi]
MNSVFDWFIVILGSYFILWGIPCTYQSMKVSLGNIKNIQFIDEQFSSGKAKQYHSMTSFDIGTRFTKYCMTYPFICGRVSTESKVFRLMMWLNCLWFYSFIFLFLAALIKKFSV